MKEIREWLGDEWARQLAGVIQLMTQQEAAAEWAAGAAEPLLDPGADMLWWEQPLTLAPEAPLWAGLPRETWTELGGRTLRAAGVESAEPSEARQTCGELLAQSFAGLAAALAASRGENAACVKGGERSGAPGVACSTVTVVLFGFRLPPILFGIHPGFLEALQQPSAAVSTSKENRPPAAPPAPSLANEAPAAARNLELLLDVEMPVSVSFGCAQLPLQDVLKLTAGSVVELNRTISDPVELIVNNRVVATGEVVVVDGNYGVRIQRIVSRQERLAGSKEEPLASSSPPRTA